MSRYVRRGTARPTARHNTARYTRVHSGQHHGAMRRRRGTAQCDMARRNTVAGRLEAPGWWNVPRRSGLSAGQTEARQRPEPLDRRASTWVRRTSVRRKRCTQRNHTQRKGVGGDSAGRGVLSDEPADSRQQGQGSTVPSSSPRVRRSTYRGTCTWKARVESKECAGKPRTEESREGWDGMKVEGGREGGREGSLRVTSRERTLSKDRADHTTSSSGGRE